MDARAKMKMMGLQDPWRNSLPSEETGLLARKVAGRREPLTLAFRESYRSRSGKAHEAKEEQSEVHCG